MFTYLFLQVNVKMKDLISDIEWIWEKNKFINRKYLMQEMYQNFVEGDDWETPEVRFIFDTLTVLSHHNV